GCEAALDQILVDVLGVAAELDRRLDPGALFFAGQASLLWRPSRWRGNLTRLVPGFPQLRAVGHPGGICLPRVAADCLAIHPRRAFDLALTGAPLQEGAEQRTAYRSA